MNELTSVDIILSVIFTWVIGLLPPILIRFVFLKRPIAKWPAIGICSFFWLCNMVLFTALGSKSKTHAVLWLIAWISYLILRRENKTSNSKFPKKITSEGMRRLGIMMGALASVAWIICIAILLNGFADIQPLGWLIFFIDIPISFGIMFLVVWGVDWVIAGFRTGAKR